MKEKLYTIPLNDAVNAGDECPFCYIERNVEQDLMDFVLGSCASYMESDVREDTDREGFCRTHMKKMFDYGNTLGNGWILKTYYKKLLSEMDGEFRHFRPQKQSMGDKLRKIAPKNSVADWVQKKESTCYICDRFQKEYERYLDTFFYLYEKDPDFKARIAKSKGFCLHHFGELCSSADTRLSESETNDTKIKPLYEPRGAQIEALCALEDTRAEGAQKALIQAATGIGKTFLAAFDSKKYEKVLFVAHREEILKQAAVSFQNVRNSKDYGFFMGAEKCTDKSLIFASVASLGKPEYLNEK